MAGRYVLREGSPGGERDLGRDDDPEVLLACIDVMEIPRRRVVDVIDTDAVDQDEAGVVIRCPGCGRVTLRSRVES